MRIRFGPAVLTLGLAACAPAGPPPIGAWACEDATPGSGLTMNIDYAPDGAMMGKARFLADQPGGAFDIGFSFTGSWRLAGDQLTQAMTGMQAAAATINGEGLPRGLKAKLVSGFSIETTYTLKAEGATMTLSGPANLACRRR